MMGRRVTVVADVLGFRLNLEMDYAHQAAKRLPNVQMVAVAGRRDTVPSRSARQWRCTAMERLSYIPDQRKAA